MHEAIPHPAGLFSGRVAARFTAAGWASGTRRAPPRLGRRGVISLVVGLQLGLVMLGAQLLREVATMRHSQASAAAQQISWPAAELPQPAEPAFPTTPALSPEAVPDRPPVAPDAAPAPSAPEFLPPPAPVPTARLAEAAPVVPSAPVVTPVDQRSDQAQDLAHDQSQERGTQIEVVATGYCPCELCCGGTSDGYTAIMRDAHRHRGIAVDPKLIPYRTMLTVPGYGTAMVDDTGEAMRRDGAHGVVHLDLRFKTHSQAKAWGVRHVMVSVPTDSRAAALGAGRVAAAEEADDNNR